MVQNDLCSFVGVKTRIDCGLTEAKTYDVIVIGAGLAGISAALRARHKGNSVLVIEKNAHPGGKLDVISEKGYRFDTGPSLFTEPYLVDELFELFDKNPRDYFNYERQEDSCTYYFTDGDKIRLSEVNSTGLSTQDEQEIEDYLEKSLNDYETVGQIFLERPAIKPVEFLHPRYYKYYGYFTSSRMRNSLASLNAKKFSNPKISQIFNRFGTYNGSSPFAMKGLFSMIPSLELKLGTYFPTEGMRSIVDSVYSLATEVGVDFQFGVHTTDVKKRDPGYIVQANRKYECDKLICAIDHLTFYKKILKDNELLEKYKRAPRSSSGLVFYWGLNKKIDELGLHTILFSDTYKDEFDGLFKDKKTIDRPTIYLHNSTVVCPQDAPENGQTLFVMINIPAEESISSERRAFYRAYVIERIKKDLGVDISASIQFEDYQDNYRIMQNTGSYLGALYGANSNSMKAVTNRHPNTIKTYKDLFFCGGTVHPGGGIPLVLRSSKIISELL